MSQREHSISEVSDLSDTDVTPNEYEDVAETHQNIQSPDRRSSTPFILQDDEKDSTKSAPVLAESLERRHWALWLVFFYAIAAFPSWATTCWLSYRPIGISAYNDVQNSADTTLSDWNYSDRCRRAASIGLSIIAAIGIPVTSAICAKATVVYCQMKNSNSKTRSLTLRQTLALADKGWSDLGVIWDLVRPSASRRTRSPLLLFSVFLVGLALLLPILQSAYIVTSHIQILSDEFNQQLLGFSINPAQIRNMDLTSVLNHVTSTVLDGSLFDKDPYLWPVGGGNVSVKSPLVRDKDEADLGPQPTLFTASFPVGTDTGLFQDYVLRLNFTLHCERLSQTEYPSLCLGNNPFNKTYTNINNSSRDPFTDETSPKYRVRICAPGDSAASPWNLTGNRQDVFEEYYLDAEFTRTMAGSNSFTQHCTSSTSMGYFELPNYYNNHTAGDLLGALPPSPPTSPNDAAFPDPSVNLTGPTGLPIPGPMMLSVLAIFGSGSFFDAVAVQRNYSDRESMLVCEQLRQPFSGLGWTYPQSYTPLEPVPKCSGSNSTTGNANANALVNALLDWLPLFGNPDAAAEALNLAMFSTLKSVLTTEAYPFDAIFRNPGHDIQKPNISLMALIVITVLLSAQIICLAGLAIYASLYPTWTHTLDAFALLRMGASLGQELPLISNIKASAMLSLDEKEGWIGASSIPSGQQEDDRRDSPRILVIGGLQRTESYRPYLTVPDDGSWCREESKVSLKRSKGVEPRKKTKSRTKYRRVKTTIDE